MKISEYLMERFELVVNDFTEEYGVLTDRKAKQKYINEPFMSEEDLLNLYESETSDYCYDDELEIDITLQEQVILEQKLIDQLKEKYKHIKEQREEFERKV